MSILIKEALVDNEIASVYVEDNRIVEIGGPQEADHVLDGRGKAVLPGMVNTHTHAAMTLFRGYAEDLSLRDWLETRISPAERRLTPEHVYWGTKLACLEMLKTGTTSFNDMYFHMDEAAKAVQEMGLRAVLSQGLIDLMDPDIGQAEMKKQRAFLGRIEALRVPRIRGALGPHALYTVSRETLQAVKDLSDEKGYPIHFHLSETETEVEDCVVANEARPAEYLDKIGFLGGNLIAAHGCWLEGAEIDLLARHGVKVSHCPTSNMKLSTGRALPYRALRDAGVLMSLGTDGAASNNNLDMFESMKMAALLQKFATGDATVLPAGDAWQMATLGGASALDIDAGAVEAGRLADLLIIDLQRAELTPARNLIANLVYSGDGHCVNTVIIDGEIVMKARRVKGEAEILQKAAEFARSIEEEE